MVDITKSTYYQKKGKAMTKEYRQLTLKERKEIEAGLARGDSFRQIARTIDRNPSTVSREVRENRHVRAFKGSKGACRERNWCKRTGVCAECLHDGAYCASCNAKDCRDYCSAYAKQITCDALVRAPWVCNGCRKNRYGCNRQTRFIYEASVAQKVCDARRSDSRKGIDMSPERAEVALSYIKECLSRGLSPYEISVLYADVVGVHRSTIYRWVEAGYGGLSNLELERKVGFKPRKKTAIRKATKHSPKRSHDTFLLLSDAAKQSRSELDCVIGRSGDTQAILTLYNLPCHIQLALLLDACDCASVRRELSNLKSVMPKSMFERWMRTVLTDNGVEFADEDGIGEILGETIVDGKMSISLYYCDPRQSQQKGSCEKNHTEIRQILEKGAFSFDELTRRDMAVLMSHVNSNPRASLGGKSPIQMLRFVYGENDANALLEALGIEEKDRDELCLKPEILDIERVRRNEVKLARIK